MATFVISFELNRPSLNYDKLRSAVESAENWWHCLDKTWIVQTDATATDIATEMWALMDPTDKLFVAQLGTDTAWAGFTGRCEKWLSKNVRAKR